MPLRRLYDVYVGPMPEGGGVYVSRKYRDGRSQECTTMVRKALYSAAVTGVAGLLLLVSAPMPQAHAEMTALDELTAFPEPTTALSESIDVCLGSGEQVACIERLAGSPEGRGQAGSIAAYIGRRINEDEAADFAAAIARGAGDPDEANAAFMALASR